MNSKERVARAIRHQEPDRVPVDYGANQGIQTRLMAHFGLKADDHEGLLRALGVDFRGVWAGYKGPRLHAEIAGRHVDACWGIRTRWIQHESGGYWDFCDFPLAEASMADVEAWPMPSPDDFDYSHIAENCRRNREFCCVYGCMPDIINATGMMRSMEQTLVDLALDDEAGMRLIDRRLAILLEVSSRALAEAEGGVDMWLMGDDLGSQNSPLISMDMFRKHIRPRYEPFMALARRHNIPVMMHSCGSSSWAFEEFIKMGVQAMDTLQPEAKDMAPAYLKARFGGRLAFHGCISTGGPVAFGTVDEVIADCRRTLEIMMPGGGYCFAPTHALQDNSPTENVVAMYEAANQYGHYR
jgi:uroporphyrinogen decarboxylase